MEQLHDPITEFYYHTCMTLLHSSTIPSKLSLLGKLSLQSGGRNVTSIIEHALSNSPLSNADVASVTFDVADVGWTTVLAWATPEIKF